MIKLTCKIIASKFARTLFFSFHSLKPWQNIAAKEGKKSNSGNTDAG